MGKALRLGRWAVRRHDGWAAGLPDGWDVTVERAETDGRRGTELPEVRDQGSEVGPSSLSSSVAVAI